MNACSTKELLALVRAMASVIVIIQVDHVAARTYHGAASTLVVVITMMLAVNHERVAAWAAGFGHSGESLQATSRQSIY